MRHGISVILLDILYPLIRVLIGYALNVLPENELSNMLGTQQKSRPGVNRGGVFGTNPEELLLCDFVRALSSGILRGLDGLASLAAQDAYEPTYCVLLPARRFHNLGQRCAFRPLHHGDDLGFLVALLGRFLGGGLNR